MDTTIQGNSESLTELEPLTLDDNTSVKIPFSADTSTPMFNSNTVLSCETGGLDIPSIKTVVNYDVARDIDTHTHRVGRTGRAGEKGFAFTLITNKDKDFAGALLRNLEGANQHVPSPLLDLAMQSPWFKQTRFKQNKGRRLPVVGGSLGQRERPGLGAESGSRLNDSTSFTSFRAGTSLGRGPQTDRLSAMKSAFTSQYKANFVAALDSAPKVIPTGIHEPENPAPAHSTHKRRKKSRWE